MEQVQPIGKGSLLRAALDRASLDEGDLALLTADYPVAGPAEAGVNAEDDGHTQPLGARQASGAEVARDSVRRTLTEYLDYPPLADVNGASRQKQDHHKQAVGLEACLAAEPDRSFARPLDSGDPPGEDGHVRRLEGQLDRRRRIGRRLPDLFERLLGGIKDQLDSLGSRQARRREASNGRLHRDASGFGNPSGGVVDGSIVARDHYHWNAVVMGDHSVQTRLSRHPAIYPGLPDDGGTIAVGEHRG